VLRSECGKTRDLRGTQRWEGEPGDDPSDIDGRRRDHMLELRFWSPKVACLVQVPDAYGLRDSTFDACADSIGLFERFGPLPLSRRLQSELGPAYTAQGSDTADKQQQRT
jgi:hypothetical protein